MRDTPSRATSLLATLATVGVAVAAAACTSCTDPAEPGEHVSGVTAAPEPASATDAATPTESETRTTMDDDAETVMVRVFDREGRLVGPVASPRVVKSDAQWRLELGEERYRILRNAGTEAAFCGTLLDNHMEGVYACGGCGLPLFSSDSKFESGSGWPSFFRPIAPENVVEKEDFSHFMHRIEIECARCGGHLGHVFEDGPKPTGRRFCLNSESLDFTRDDELASLADPAAER
ncbi:MAG: peptide-methionine (R)-S-oxide reductase MsrB [Planctomycetota bacterium]